MQLSVKSTIPFPVQRVYEAMRDHMPKLADYIPNVDSIIVKTKEYQGDTLYLVNQWNPSMDDIPSVAQPFIPEDKQYWLDYAYWKDAERACDWRLEMAFMPNRITCNGRTAFFPLNDKTTEMRIQGELILNLKGRVPRLFLNKATKGVEKFVGKLIEPNFKKTAQALTDFLRENG